MECACHVPQVHFIIAACENMVAGKGLRPGDILTGASGKTVEVRGTAEPQSASTVQHEPCRPHLLHAMD